ncbi:circularly permuted type 2 ATP-grasp protein [Exilibacterium tricleocarpae]|uniref:Circularly permuted type 2 ATP-grasp protein n=1 Tax=Exilibacterium tricleocarpae TaxID=2591008 RepID=A0A545U6S1_9GAMM|nr:circularly permuted type 2 ATP-grasp protein [Exilibacterium tricleocarpae]TQV85165.1 circularly permuted type 2 ATP-grasp protein [Exilibacterium tricleocarpae]
MGASAKRAATVRTRINWADYDPGIFYDELISSPDHPRVAARGVISYLRRYSEKKLMARQKAADLAIQEMGISFTVYSEGTNIDRAWPVDIIPRVIPRKEWQRLEQGLVQRLTALNLFIDDVYNEQRIIKDKVFPAEIIHSSKDFLKQCVGIKPRHRVWAHICGSDLVRDKDGTVYVLEDNLRVPSGVSYLLENRAVTKRILPQLFRQHYVLPVDDYPSQLFDMLASLSPRPSDDPEIVVMTPGIYNSAYFEHAYLAQRMGAELVEGSDLVVGDDDCVYMKTIQGLERVDVIYRRVNDDFLDPEAFRANSQLGTPGLFRAWRAGNVGLANAPGAGVADDKVVYTYVPDIIRFYLDQDPIIPNVPSYLCVRDTERDHVLANLENMVVKPANESGGYGMLVGPASTQAERRKFTQLIKKHPRNYMAQPALSLSTAPTLCGGKMEPRHLDLRPFILQGSGHYVTAGGLTRVAMRRGSLVVNSSQGGGSKDTWVVDTEGRR